jgi:Na+/H+ antiporter NhaC
LSLSLGILSLIPVIISVAGAVISRKPFESLLVGSLTGCILAFKSAFLTNWISIMQTTVADNVWIILVCGLFGSLIALLKESKGIAGFAKIGNKICKTQRSTKLTTFFLGVAIFVDDYLNMLSVGTCMRKISDDKRLPRESLAFLLDSTGTPVCMLLPFSTWGAFYITLFMKQDAVINLGFKNGMDMFMSMVPFNFYAISTVLITLLFAIGTIPPLFEMKKAYQRVQSGGNLWSDKSAYLNVNEKEEENDGNIIDFIIPMVLLIGVTFASDILTGVVVALAVSLVLFVSRKKMTVNQWTKCVWDGFCDMIPTLMALMAAFMVANTSDKMGLTKYIVNTVTSYPFPFTFPMIVFLIVAAITFSTGSFWGTSTLVTPFLLPLAVSLKANVVLTMAAILSGCTFGSHACFFSDANMLAAQASRIEVMDHNLSQLPYIIIAASITFILLGVCGFIMT